MQTNDFHRLTFLGGRWQQNGTTIFGLTQDVIRSNRHPFITLELRRSRLNKPLEVIFSDPDTAAVLDRVVIPAGSLSTAVRTLPLFTQNVDVTVSSGGNWSSNEGFELARGFAPSNLGGLPQGPVLTLTDINDLRLSPVTKSLADLAPSVALLQISNGETLDVCTGFLIGPGLLATAAHCLRDVVEAEPQTDRSHTACRNIAVMFDYFASPGGGSQTLRPSVAHCIAIFYIDRSPRIVGVPGYPGFTQLDDTDVAVLRITVPAMSGNTHIVRAPIPLGPDPDNSVLIASVIQHPYGLPMKVASNCIVNKLPGANALISHKCSTTPGSSGSPILTYEKDHWSVTGMHTCCSDQPLLFTDSQKAVLTSLGLSNVGVRSSSIRRALNPKLER